MPFALPRRMLALTALVLAAGFALSAAPRAHAAINCDLQPTAPICNRDGDTPPPPPPPGGGGSTAPSHDPYFWTTTRSDQVGGGENISTSMTIDRLYGDFYGTVHVWTANWFWGFNGCVQFDFLNAAGQSIDGHLSPPRCQAVNGTVLGGSDRTMTLQMHLNANEINWVHDLRIVHSKA
jgi:hypothetical protein